MKTPIRIVIDLEGGLIQAIYTDASQASIPIDVIIRDFDTDGASEDELTELPSGRECILRPEWIITDIDVINESFAALEAVGEFDQCNPTTLPNKLENVTVNAQTEKRIIATFHPQSWLGDFAAPAEPLGHTEFDVTDAINAMSETDALSIEDDDYSSDDLRFSDNAPEWAKDWDGPFWVQVEDSIKAYFEKD
jgi:hypothetical protein